MSTSIQQYALFVSLGLDIVVDFTDHHDVGVYCLVAEWACVVEIYQVCILFLCTVPVEIWPNYNEFLPNFLCHIKCCSWGTAFAAFCTVSLHKGSSAENYNFFCSTIIGITSIPLPFRMFHLVSSVLLYDRLQFDKYGDGSRPCTCPWQNKTTSCFRVLFFTPWLPLIFFTNKENYT